MISWVLFKVELLIFGSNSSPLFLVKSFTVQLKVEIKRYKKASYPTPSLPMNSVHYTARVSLQFM